MVLPTADSGGLPGRVGVTSLMLPLSPTTLRTTASDEGRYTERGSPKSSATAARHKQTGLSMASFSATRIRASDATSGVGRPCFERGFGPMADSAGFRGARVPASANFRLGALQPCPMRRIGPRRSRK